MPLPSTRAPKLAEMRRSCASLSGLRLRAALKGLPTPDSVKTLSSCSWLVPMSSPVAT